MYIYIYIYIYPYRETRGFAGREKQPQSGALGTVSFHDFKSQNFKLSVSNPKSK